MNQVIIGLSGHIDHGKTSLIRALTGTNTDTIKEEIKRGMTIDIGFAFLDKNITMIDVPGHEKFLKNMMTGVSSIDIALLVIAADDGVMQQTKEHLDILNLLGIKNGCIAINKVDLVDSEWLELVKSDVLDLVENTFLSDAPIIEVSAIKNKNIENLKNILINISQSLPSKNDSGIFRMHIDRAFVKKGFGTVVTGTVLSGELAVGEDVEIMPNSIKARVRNIQSHEQMIDRVMMGDRAAINLQGIDKQSISRGSQIVKTNYFIQTNQIAAIIELLPNEKNILKHNQRIRIHIGTQEVIARIFFSNKKSITSDTKYVCLIKLESFITVTMNDKFIIRTFSPMQTIGGGIIIDNELRGRWKEIKKYLGNIYDDIVGIQLDKIIENYFSNPMTFEQAKFKLGLSIELLSKKIENNDNIYIIKFKSDTWIVTIDQISKIKKMIEDFLIKYHRNNPYLKGVIKEEIRQLLKSNDNFTDYILNEMKSINLILKDENFWYFKSHKITLSDDMKNNINNLQDYLKKENFLSFNSSDLAKKLNVNEKLLKTIVDIAISTNKVVKIDGNIIISEYFHKKILNGILEHFNKSDVMSVTDFKKIADTSRKFAVPLLEFLDKNKITYRDGNNRKLVR